MLLTLLAIAVIVGATTQRITGMGFSLICSPLVVLLLGPTQGVALTNLCGIAMGFVAICVARGTIDWGIVWRLGLGAVCGVVPGALLTVWLPARELSVGIGVAVLISVAATALMARNGVRAPAGSIYVAGALSGLMSAAASLGGPAVSAWAVMAPSPPRSFALSVQPYFALTSTAAVTAKLIAGGGGVLPDLSALSWLLMAGCLAIGWVLGTLLVPRLSPSLVRNGLLVVAALGGVGVILNALR